MVAVMNIRVVSVCVLPSFVGFLSVSNWIGDVFIHGQTNLFVQNIQNNIYIYFLEESRKNKLNKCLANNITIFLSWQKNSNC